MKKILLLSDITSTHTKKWVNILTENAFDVGIFSLSVPEDKWHEEAGVSLISETGFESGKFHASQASKLTYIRQRNAVRKAIKEFKPDVVHAHYATSYGLLGAMSGFHPYYISVWGSDLLLFPSNPINKLVIKYNFRKADKIIVSSHVLANESRKYTRKDVRIIPFGIDTDLFTAGKRPDKEEIVIGTVKSLENVYGIDLLIKAFAKLTEKIPGQKFLLHIIGEGTQKEVLSGLVSNLGLEGKVYFFNRLTQLELVPIYHAFDIGVFLSRSESFGVSILEASATELPVVVAEVGGLKEVVDNEKTGFFVPPENVDIACEKIMQLVMDKELRRTMGKAGRQKVIDEYELKDTVKDILDLYEKEIS